MPSLRAPRVFARGRWISGQEIDLAARRYLRACRAVTGPAPLAAVVVPSGLDGVVVALASTALESAVVLLPPDTRAWRSSPALPAATPVLLHPTLGHLEGDVLRAGWRPCLVSDDGSGEPPHATWLTTPGMAWFTSGSTGLPRPVYRTADAIRSCVAQRLDTLPLPAGAGIVSSDALAHGQGFIEFLLACGTAGAFAPLDPMNVRGTLALLAQPDFVVWFTTPSLAAFFSRCPVDGPVSAPPFCFVAGGASRGTVDAFSARFGRPLRQHYGSSEGGPVAMDAATDAAVRPGTVGRLVRGVDVRVGDTPFEPDVPGRVGRLWLRSPGQMAGYGFPPDLDASMCTDGWVPTRDLGSFDADGYLTLAGRMDDCIRVRDGRLVNLARVTQHLRDVDDVTDAVTLPIATDTGLTFGAVVEGTVAPDRLREQLASGLPSWSWPRDLLVLPALPRLPNGKVDRDACGRLLSTAGPSHA